MNIENLVPRYETCLEAKELGFPQDTYVYDETHQVYVARPTLQEVLEELPVTYYSRDAQSALERWIDHKKAGMI